jgi:ribosomal protein S18 acetylase RimI-like enzyme
MAPAAPAVTLREKIRPSDIQAVRDIVTSTGFFYDFEIGTAVELAEDALAKGAQSEYCFLFADQGGRTVGYSCFGAIACTFKRYDLYWIAVHQDCRRLGIGQRLLRATEEAIARRGGKRIYVETSGRPQYDPTRRFYLSNRYRIEAELKDYYGDGDNKVIYVNDFELKTNDPNPL